MFDTNKIFLWILCPLYFDATILASKEASDFGFDKILPLQSDIAIQFMLLGSDLSGIPEASGESALVILEAA